VGLVGAGVQARTQLLGLSRIFKIDHVVVSDRSLESAIAFEKDSKAFLECDYFPTTNPKEACDCDILVTATPARQPSSGNPGSSLEHISTPSGGRQRKARTGITLTWNSKVVVDDILQAVHSGEVNVPISEGVMRQEDIYAQIGEILVGRKLGRISQEEITIFDSTGLGIQDVATSFVIYKRALEMGKGIKLRLS